MKKLIALSLISTLAGTVGNMRAQQVELAAQEMPDINAISSDEVTEQELQEIIKADIDAIEQSADVAPMVSAEPAEQPAVATPTPAIDEPATTPTPEVAPAQTTTPAPIAAETKPEQQAAQPTTEPTTPVSAPTEEAPEQPASEPAPIDAEL